MTNIVKEIETIIPTSKVGLQTLAVDLIEQLDTGEVNALELLRTFKLVEKLQEMVKEKMISSAVAQLSRYPEKEVDLYGVTFEKMEGGVTYNFEGCNDEVYSAIQSQKEILKKEEDKRVKFLKSIDGSINIEHVDESSGEVTAKTIYPPVKKSTSTLKVTLK